MKKPGIIISLIPVIILIAIIFTGVRLFGEDVTAGPSQIALLFTSVLTAIIAIYHLKIPWEKLEAGIMDHLTKTGSAVFILLMIGALTGSWMISGVVPTMIYYGLKMIHPSVFLVVSFILAGIVSVMAGSSWTTIGTIGVAMLSAGQILGFSAPWLAGAIISGAYFGDKISPLSDTTNLSASVAGVDLYKHVKYMLITTIPGFILTVIFFSIAGFIIPAGNSLDIENQLHNISSTFNISPFLLLVPVLTIIMIVKKISPFITLFISALTGAVVACIAQPEICSQISPANVSKGASYIYASLKMLSGSVSIETGDQMLNTLTSTRGMAGMLNTVWIILCVVTFGGIMEASGMIKTITEKMMFMMKNTVSLISSTVGTTIFFNMTLSDQYMAILLPGKMFSETYDKLGYEPEVLSRTLQDSATVTSVLVPWNTCGVVQSSVLNVATLAYLPYCFFNLITPVITIAVAAIGYKIRRKKVA
ncbi:MAG: sodium:proton antiporter [Bacteroidetes bacterium GWE2_39_28]|nr:MAG: sodium:proton antiporter [Bacteroidetes bacterium GWE2_39_28]OFY15196.1 MAG: sodium:proton antiporter [Bacteroidetes bacterium GWF2_39_10]OFZ09180.1 MAG: sodium:proton antiporter [Bacteroidetes bacterium RIFOXYB2_FULL_39_7]OFZ09783.1 MAG: sodium:proton antiporter [Bacteroidetes bacterium RIFOXYC2_FULL_39_11]HCT93822.1 sodium:proton antiporter [Rikenellaceae bacterium]